MSLLRLGHTSWHSEFLTHSLSGQEPLKPGHHILRKPKSHGEAMCRCSYQQSHSKSQLITLSDGHVSEWGFIWHQPLGHPGWCWDKQRGTILTKPYPICRPLSKIHTHCLSHNVLRKYISSYRNILQYYEIAKLNNTNSFFPIRYSYKLDTHST